MLENTNASSSADPASLRSSMDLIRNLDSVPAEVTNRDIYEWVVC